MKSEIIRRTLKEAFTLSGIGLHSGLITQVKVMPAQANRGRYFVRIDLPEQPVIPAQLLSVSQTTLSTELAADSAKVRTVEHLLAALAATGIEDARIEVNGIEIPLLDGSAKCWLDAIAQAGIKNEVIEDDSIFHTPISLSQPILVQEQDSFVVAMPSSETRFTYGIDFPYKAIASQWHSWTLNPDTFATEIAPARTFGFAEQIQQLQQAGLIKGGNLDNALVCSTEGWLNPPLRFTNEPARHKLLDLVGDLSLLGQLPQAHFLAYKASHKLHIELAYKIADSMANSRSLLLTTVD